MIASTTPRRCAGGLMRAPSPAARAAAWSPAPAGRSSARRSRVAPVLLPVGVVNGVVDLLAGRVIGHVALDAARAGAALATGLGRAVPASLVAAPGPHVKLAADAHHPDRQRPEKRAVCAAGRDVELVGIADAVELVG